MSNVVLKRLSRELPLEGAKVNLGCGSDVRPGWLNVDLYAPNADQRFDLFRFPWPLGSRSADFVLADQVIEHIPPMVDGKDGLLLFLAELHRILKPGGVAYLGTPHFRSYLSAIKNVTHYRFFMEESLDFLDPSIPGRDADLQQQAGVEFRIRRKIVLRRLKFGRWFDSQYHIPKYLRFRVNVGRPWGLVFILQRAPRAPGARDGF